MGDNPGFLIAVDLTLLYLIMGPLVLFGIYILFDFFSRVEEKPSGRFRGRVSIDPALWTVRDVWSDF